MPIGQSCAEDAGTPQVCTIDRRIIHSWEVIRMVGQLSELTSEHPNAVSR